MRHHEPSTAWLPSTEQIMVSSERAILAALDVNLELAIRSLRAEHVVIGPRPLRQSSSKADRPLSHARGSPARGSGCPPASSRKSRQSR
jgi:hypothetical protein